jgi:hypothetical protein
MIASSSAAIAVTPDDPSSSSPASSAALVTTHRGSGGAATTAVAASQRETLAAKIKARLEAEQREHSQRDEVVTKLTRTTETPQQPLLEQQPLSNPPRLELSLAAFEQDGNTQSLRIRLITNLPDGGELHAHVRYGGDHIAALTGSALSAAGRAELLLGPVRGFLSSGRYTVTISLDTTQQSAAFLLELRRRFGERAPAAPLHMEHVVTLRKATLLEGELRTALLHYEEIWSVATTLVDTLEETAQAVKTGERFRAGDRRDERALREWLDRWLAQVHQLHDRQRQFARRFAAPPHPHLATHIKQILICLADPDYHQGSFSDGSGEEPFFKTEDFATLIRRALYAIDIVIKGIAEEAERAEQLVARLTKLATGPNYGESTEAAARIERYLEWLETLRLAIENPQLGDHWQPFLELLEPTREDLIREQSQLLRAWLGEARQSPPRDLVLPNEPPVIRSTQRLEQLTALVAERIASAPKPEFLKEHR